MNRDLLGDIETVSRAITHRELNEDVEFMKEFASVLFIPHTERISSIDFLA